MLMFKFEFCQAMPRSFRELGVPIVIMKERANRSTRAPNSFFKTHAQNNHAQFFDKLTCRRRHQGRCLWIWTAINRSPVADQLSGRYPRGRRARESGPPPGFSSRSGFADGLHCSSCARSSQLAKLSTKAGSNTRRTEVSRRNPLKARY